MILDVACTKWFYVFFAASTALSPITTLVWECKTIRTCCRCCSHYAPFTIPVQNLLSLLCHNTNQLSARN